MGRTADFLKYQDHRALRRKVSKSRKAGYQRKWYWTNKLRKLGVPEADLEREVSGVLSSRSRSRFNHKNPEKLSKWRRSWYYRNIDYCRQTAVERYAKQAREDRQRLLVAIGG